MCTWVPHVTPFLSGVQCYPRQLGRAGTDSLWSVRNKLAMSGKSICRVQRIRWKTSPSYRHGSETPLTSPYSPGMGQCNLTVFIMLLSTTMAHRQTMYEKCRMEGVFTVLAVSHITANEVLQVMGYPSEPAAVAEQWHCGAVKEKVGLSK